MTKRVRIILESGIGEIPSKSGQGKEARSGDSARIPKVILRDVFAVTKRAPHVTIHAPADIHGIRVERFIIVRLGRISHQTLGFRVRVPVSLGAGGYHVKAETTKFVTFYLH